MLRRILCIIGILWGIGILVSMFTRGGPQGAGAYAAGQFVGLALGVLMIFAGIYNFNRGSSRGDKHEPND